MLQNEPLITAIGIDTAEKCTNENLQNLLNLLNCQGPRYRLPPAPQFAQLGLEAGLSKFADRAFLGSIDADRSDQWLILQHFQRSTRFSQNVHEITAFFKRKLQNL